ncbi:MAG: ATP-binding protein [Dehalococcoidales bacterium]|nr:ATP-binding protein [Dehalococcoidales bacterium]
MARTNISHDESKIASEALRTLIPGWVLAAVAGSIAMFILWLFNREMPLAQTLVLVGYDVTISFGAYLINRAGRPMFAGHFFVTGVVLLCAAITLIFGGFTGSMAVVYLLPILLAGIVIGIRSAFVTAGLVTLVYLAMIQVELSGFLASYRIEANQVITIVAFVLFFFLTAFLSWYAASRLHLAFRKVSDYAAELQTSNEKLQASEEELRAANEELEASNEELRATEEELRASNEELAAANEELKDAQEKVVRTEKLAAIGQLAGGVGHELRNPLGAIKNAVYYIRGKLEKSELAQKEPRVMEFLGIADEEITSSNKIISDLLNFSRVGKPATSPARIETVINDAIAHTVIQENIAVNKTLPGDLPEIQIDTDLIRQVLVNLFTNAVQAMPEGGSLTVGAHRNGEFMEVAVADSGTGIKPENMKRLFDPLFTTKAKGIGLGLAVCKSIIDRHKGRIEVTSQIGKGTIFSIKLPLINA